MRNEGRGMRNFGKNPQADFILLFYAGRRGRRPLQFVHSRGCSIIVGDDVLIVPRTVRTTLPSVITKSLIEAGRLYKQSRKRFSRVEIGNPEKCAHFLGTPWRAVVFYCLPSENV